MAKKETKFLGFTDEELIERIATEYNNAYEFRKPNITEWHANENILYGKKPKSLSKRSNIMVQLAAGYEDTLLSKIKQPMLVVFTPTEMSDTIRARKVTDAWKLETSVSHEDWGYKDLLVKKLAIISGRGIFKIYSGTPYKHRLDPVDHYDFLVDPLCNGMNLESARYLGQDNIILSEWDLKNTESYDQAKVKEVLAAYAEDNSESPDGEDREKSNRFAVLGMNYSDYFQAGDASYKFLEWYTTLEGERVVLLANIEKRIIIKKEELKNVTGELNDYDKPFWPFESWAFYPDLFNFWSPSPMSRVRELFELRNVSLNQMFDNNEAKNKPMRAFNPKIFTNPSLLTYQPDRLIPTSSGADPEKGLFTLPVNDISEPKVFQEILESITGKITGVTASGAGSSDVKKVGIYYGDQQETEKRMTLFEISYNRCHLRLGQKYLKYLSERLTKDVSIKILGEDGVEFEDLTQEDLADFDITITGGMTQAANDALEKKAKNEFLNAQVANPIANKKFLLELGAAINGFSQDDIKRLTTVADVDEAQVVRASQDIQKILLGETFRPFLKAEVSYMQHIFDFVYDKELDQEDEDKILAYLGEIQPIVVQNMLNKARAKMANQGMLQVPDEFAQAEMAQEGASVPEQVDPNNPNKPNLDTQAGLDQQRVQEIPAESQGSYDRAN